MSPTAHKQPISVRLATPTNNLERAFRATPGEPFRDIATLPDLNVGGYNVDPTFVDGYLYFSRYSPSTLATATTYAARRTADGSFESAKPMTPAGQFGAKPVPGTARFVLNDFVDPHIRPLWTFRAAVKGS